MHASRECLLINTSIKILPQSLLMPKIWRIHFCLYYRTTQKPRWIISDERHRQTPNRCECLRPEGDQGIMTQHGNAVYCIDMYTLQPLPQDRRWIDAAVRMHFTLFGRKEEKRESRSPYFECRNSPSPLIVSRRLRHCFNTNDSWLFEADDATHLYRSGHQLPMTARRRLHYPYREPIHLVAMSWSVLSFILSSLYTLSWNSIAIPPTSL